MPEPVKIIVEAKDEVPTGIWNAVDWLLDRWTKRASLFAFSGLHETTVEPGEYRKYLRRRDRLVVVLLLLAFVALWACPRVPYALYIFSGIALHRSMDIFAGFASIGIMGYLRKDIKVKSLPPWRIQ